MLPNKNLKPKLKSGLQKSRAINQTKDYDTPSVTKVLVTLNPNKVFKPNRPEANDLIQEKIWDILEDMEQNAMETIVGNATYIKSIKTSNYAIEVGSKFHRIHAHFVLTIKHFLEKYSLKKLQQRLQDWLNDNGSSIVPASKNWSVYLRLLPLYAANYTSKEGRYETAQRKKYLDKEEYDRLSDPRTETTVSHGWKHFKVMSNNLATIESMSRTGIRNYNSSI